MAADEILEKFSTKITPTDLSNEIHHVAKVISANIDPYKQIKIQEMEVSKKIFLGLKTKGGLRERIAVAAMGNALDFFVGPEALAKTLNQRPTFAVDEIDELNRRLRKTRRILYIPDNAGELFFDIPLLDYLSKRADVLYAARAEPVQNDLSIDDLQILDGIKLPATVIKGPPTVGVYLAQAPVEFRIAFDVVDLIIAKGMANYETLSELPSKGRFFHILKAKCKPVAKSIGIKVGEYAAVFH